MLWVVTLAGFFPSFTSSSVVCADTNPGPRTTRATSSHSFFMISLRWRCAVQAGVSIRESDGVVGTPRKQGAQGFQRRDRRGAEGRPRVTPACGRRIDRGGPRFASAVRSCARLRSWARLDPYRAKRGHPWPLLCDPCIPAIPALKYPAIPACPAIERSRVALARSLFGFLCL